MSIRLVAAVIGLGAVAACGTASPTSTQTPLAGHAQPISLAAATSSTAAGNLAATRREAARLLALVPVPDGAKRTSHKGGGDGPAPGEPATGSSVDKHRYYVVDEPFQQVFRYLQHHRPAGLTLSGRSSGSTRGVIDSEGIVWSEPDTTYAVELQASAGVTPIDHRTETLLRVDGAGQWLDPRPIKDRTTGHRIHFAATDACPTTGRGVADINNDTDLATLKRQLLPSVAPTSALICQYDGLNRKPVSGLGRSVPLKAAAAAKLARRVAKISIPHVDGGVYSCPADSGSVDLLAFGYAGGTSVDLKVAPEGCSSTDNGSITTMGAPDLAPWAKPLAMFDSSAAGAGSPAAHPA
jgi:hypothetical protein